MQIQITPDVSKISKTFQRDLTFILNVILEYSIDFAQLSTVLAKKNVKKKTLWPLFMDGVRLPQGQNHFEEAVYFLPISPQKVLVLMLVLHKVVFIEKEDVLLCLTMLERARAFAATIQCVTSCYHYSSVFVVHFSKTFWHGNEAFSRQFLEGISYSFSCNLSFAMQLIQVVKICFHSRCYQNQNFPSCRS